VLFNSYQFIFIFLPVTLLFFRLLGNRGHHQIALSWIVVASLFFYGWWNPKYLWLILGSTLFNYGLGVSLSERQQKSVLIIGVAGNLGLLGYFKYANFFVDNINLLIGHDIILDKIILPLAISFFTFQQIAYLVDAYRGETREYNFLHYCLFVTFFPQLIAGPIVHHREMLSQFAQDALHKQKARNLAIGLVIFIIGLFKKVVIADGLATHVALIFEAAEKGYAFTFLEAWGGAFAYTFQLYFDFSGYSDMAIGLARMFGIALPANFFSPYKANSIIDFWRRWHLTLSRFFRDYLYIPLGGSRKGTIRNLLNLMIAMTLGGLWHGASWTFVVWGGLHGFYLVTNHGWHEIKLKVLGKKETSTTILGRALGRVITFIAVVLAWVVFRAESMNGARRMFQEMLGVNGFTLPAMIDYQFYSLLVFLLLVVWHLPNTLEFMYKYKPGIENYKIESEPSNYNVFRFDPSSFVHVFFIILIALLSILAMQTNETTEFLYYNF